MTAVEETGSEDMLEVEKDEGIEEDDTRSQASIALDGVLPIPLFVSVKLIIAAAVSTVSDEEDTAEVDHVNVKDGEIDGENEEENENENDDEDLDADVDAQGDGEEADPTSSPSTLKSLNREPSSSPPPRIRHRVLPAVQRKADSCSSYDIVPVLAAPHATSVNAIAATTDMRWVFTGGSDGYIRKFDHFAGMNGKVPLTVAQKHPFVDSVTKVTPLLQPLR